MQERFTSRNLSILTPQRAELPGVGEFQFTDHYSIYDLGKMPDRIPGKGEAMCRMAVANFEALHVRKVPTHFLSTPCADKMVFKLLRVIYPTRERIERGTRAYFVPLQVVFRNQLPTGASVFRRLASGQITPRDIGLDDVPQPGHILKKPIIEYMTKLDEIDEFIPRDTAQELAGLNDHQLKRLEEIVLETNEVLSDNAQAAGLRLADGKLEFGIGADGEVLLVDVAGTPDETRYLLGEQHISKQVLRDCYASTGLREEVKLWASLGRPPEMRPSPATLSASTVALISDMYKALCERWTRTRIWGAPDLADVIRVLCEQRPLSGQS